MENNKILGNQIFKEKQNTYKSLFVENKSKSQVNFLGDADFWAVVATYKFMTGITQKDLIQKAVYEMAKKEYPNFFEGLGEE